MRGGSLENGRQVHGLDSDRQRRKLEVTAGWGLETVLVATIWQGHRYLEIIRGDHYFIRYGGTLVFSLTSWGVGQPSLRMERSCLKRLVSRYVKLTVIKSFAGSS